MSITSFRKKIDFFSGLKFQEVGLDFVFVFFAAKPDPNPTGACSSGPFTPFEMSPEYSLFPSSTASFTAAGVDPELTILRS
ncbi:hypothetical protein MIMGU_mgv1a017354mg [Erythranthe guttata]|uniref:Uncharacterized protein n=1 Tax=Erythranthe guttata TaxID=4155 RepID=A0A022QMV4_ERYGU|nr:hypothetical protein MIMGU_mgv1a017354mg [Erythranthe guttata]